MRLTTVLQVGLVALVVVLLAATPAEANGGVGALILVAPVLAVVVLLPIVLIETYVLSSWVGLSGWAALWVASVANLASTLVGIPITLLLLPPGSDETDWEEAPSVSPAHCLLYVTLFWAASWVIEYQVSAWLLPGAEPHQVNAGVFYGNLATYGILAGFLLGWLAWDALAAVLGALHALLPARGAPEEQPALPEAQAAEPEVPVHQEHGPFLPVEIEALAALGFIQLPLNGNGAGEPLPVEDYEERLESHPYHPVQEE